MSDGPVEFNLRRLLSETHVSELTLTVVPLLSSDQTLEEAAEAMREVSHGSALICDEDQLVGIITERDLLRLLSEGAGFDSPVSESMTSNPQTLSTDDTLLDAVRLMDQGGYRRLPIVGSDAGAVGIIDVKTVMNYVADQVPATVYNQASNALLSVSRAEGA